MAVERQACLSLRNRLGLGCLVVVSLLGCASAGLLAALAIPAAHRPPGFAVQTCANLSLSGGFKFSGWWLATGVKGAPLWAYASARYPHCAALPWLPILPQSGQVAWP